MDVDIDVLAESLQGLMDEWITHPSKMMYFRACGPVYTEEVFLPFLTYGEYCKSPYIAPACGRRINRTWCKGECIGQACIFWGSKGIGTINLERIDSEEES